MNNKGEGPGNTPIELNEFNLPIYYLHLARGFPSDLPSLMTPSRVPLEGLCRAPQITVAVHARNL